VLQFGLDGHKGNPHHPANYPKHCVAYSSTHDSPTAMGWWQELGADEKHRSGLSTDGEDACVRMVDMVLESAAAWAIIPMQDLFCLGNDARMNRPGTQHGNWCWRQRCESLRDDLAVQIHQRLQHADRL
jgi:4-alpha-glucanotransferase